MHGGRILCGAGLCFCPRTPPALLASAHSRCAWGVGCARGCGIRILAHRLSQAGRGGHERAANLHIQRSGRRAGVCARARPSRWNRTASSAECPRGSSWYEAGQSRILPPRGVRAFDAGGEAEPGLCAGVLVLRRRDALASPGVHPPGRVRAWCGQVCAAKCIGGGVASAYGGIMPLMSEFSTRRL